MMPVIATNPKQVKQEQVMKEADPYLAQFAYFEREAPQPSWLFPLRKAGMARFAELGFPTVHDEDWRFTNVAPLIKLPFKPVLECTANRLTPDAIAKLTFGKLAATRLVFVNGHFVPQLSSQALECDGIKIKSLAA